MRVLFYPAFEQQEDLTDHYFRAIWYLNPLATHIESIVFPRKSEIDPGQRPSYLDASLANLSPACDTVMPKVETEADERDLINSADIVLVWKVDPQRPFSNIDALSGKQVIRVDHENVQYAGSYYLMVQNQFSELAVAAEEKSKTMFARIVDECSSKQGYLFGTGPNLKHAKAHDYSDGVSIACNSMVRNQELMDRLQPPIIVVGDPIFHAGPSSYAAAFRKDLIRCMDTYGSYLIVPLRDYHIYVAHLPPRFADRICAIPYEKSESPNVDLRENFVVTSTANILTLFLFPLAGSLFQRIAVSGCDGRPLEENAYFWKHDPASQFEDELHSIKAAHPAFFNVDYDDYYATHCQTVETWVNALEDKGCGVDCLTPSYIPALAARYNGDIAELEDNEDDGKMFDGDVRKAVVIVDPDGRSHAGHFFAYSRLLSEEAKRAGFEAAIIGRQDADTTQVADSIECLPVLSVHSWHVGTREDGRRSHFSDEFKAQLREGLLSLAGKNYENSVLYFYCGSLEVARIADELSDEFKNVHFHINVFWQFQLSDPSIYYRNRWRPVIGRIANNSQISLTAPTQEIADQIDALFGMKLPIAPHPSTTFSDADIGILSSNQEPNLNGRFKVLFPGGVRVDKGFHLSVETAKILAEDPSNEVIVRANPENADTGLESQIAKLDELDVEVQSSSLDEREFQAFLDDSSIVVCPYLRSAFAARTSGLVVDAMILGKPVIALTGTWLGDFVEREGFGLAVAPDAISISRAVGEIKIRYSHFAAKAHLARKSYLKKNSWNKLLNDITAFPEGSTAEPSTKMSTEAFEKRKKELIAELPSNLRSPIFLPTDRMPEAQQLQGIQRVIDLYSGPLDAHREKLLKLKSEQKSDRCFIIGNGPSLNKTNLLRLKDEVTFAMNGFFLKLPDLNWGPTFYVVEDHLVAEDRAEEINRLRGFHKLFPASLAYVIDEDADTTFFDHRPRKSFPDGFDFSFDAAKNTYAGGTVTFTCMQLAAFMGFKEIYLIGVDASYALPDDAKISGNHRVKEIDMESDDPNHFHPDYFGKGKRWHEPNVDVMIKAYEEAKRATNTRDVSIINATKGGMLEVFPRAKYDSLFKTVDAHPRVVLFDMTKIGDPSATGQLKHSLFENWPKDKILQFCHLAPKTVGVDLNGKKHAHEVKEDNAVLLSLIDDFQPEVILYRPTPETPGLHSIAMDHIRRSDVPLVTWIMDDWPAMIAGSNAAKNQNLLADWSFLLQRSSSRLSISEAMTSAFAQRYDLPFRAIANGVDPTDWPIVAERATDAPIRVRYAGSLAQNMTLDSIKMIAEAVETLSERGVDIVFEIKTRDIWYERSKAAFKKYKRTSFLVADLKHEDYREWLCNADIATIAYNFDDRSKQYTQFSLANKLPECLASGAAMFAVGPAELATIETLSEAGCAMVVDRDDLDAVVESLSKLATEPELRLDLAKQAQKIAFDKYDINDARVALKGTFVEAKKLGLKLNKELPREKRAHVDETEVVATMLSRRAGSDFTMLDVGAHFGTSASYFDQLGWTVHCFEPDPNNREKLQKKFGKSKNIIIDPRAVSDQSATGVEFFTSEQSTGISGLHAFHESHSQSGRVDITTVERIVADRSISRVDFLKIDVEGFDLNVLKGVPWDTLKPDVIECEFEDAKTVRLGHTWKDIANYLADRGYAVYVSEWHPIVQYGIPHDWRRVFKYRGQEMPDDAWGNLLAFKTDPGLPGVQAAFDKVTKFRQSKQSPVNKEQASLSIPNDRDDQTAVRAAESKLEMLKKTTNTPIVQSPTESTDQSGSRASRTAQFGAAAFSHFWARRLWSVPAAILGVAMFAATFAPQVAEFAGTLRLAMIFAVVLASILYIAFRAFSQITALRAEIQVLQQGRITQKALAPLKTTVREQAKLVSRLQQQNKSATHVDKQLFDRLDRLDLSIGRASEQAESRVRSLDADLRVALNESAETTAAHFDELSDKVASLETEAARTGNALAEANSAIKSHALEMEDTAARLATVTSQVENDSARVESVAARVESAEAESTNAKLQSEQVRSKLTNLQKWSKFDHSAWYQYFNRRLTAEHIQELTENWPKRLAMPIKKPTLGYMAERICDVERTLDGRLATSIEDVLLRSLVAMSIKGKRAEILEIGTLFGVGAATIFDATRSHFDDVHLTLLDPLEGYYHANQADILTGLNVDEATLRRNLERIGMTEENYTLVKSMSTELDAMSEVATKKYDLLIIDGDHSYAGVKTDFENYIGTVKLGGYVIFDDYGSSEWPEVQEYVDKELADVDYVARVGSSWRTCVYRVVKTVD